eukprot:2431541-Pleurochrysis_carterae.AAC.1
MRSSAGGGLARLRGGYDHAVVRRGDVGHARTGGGKEAWSGARALRKYTSHSTAKMGNCARER